MFRPCHSVVIVQSFLMSLRIICKQTLHGYTAWFTTYVKHHQGYFVFNRLVKLYIEKIVAKVLPCSFLADYLVNL